MHRPVSPWTGALLAALVAATLATALPTTATACGGLFAPPQEIAHGSAFRMAVSISNDQTTLWDAISYTGEASKFAWILPVPAKPASIDVASDSFFAWLDETSQPMVYPPPEPSSDSGGIGCGSTSDAGGSKNSLGAEQGRGVQVYQLGQVGPYAFAVVGSDDPDALFSWLNDGGFALPASDKPLLQTYIDKKWLFAAMKLDKGQGSKDVKPIRMTYPGKQLSLPLHLMSAAPAQVLPLAIWVIADKRMEAANYGNARIDAKKLRWLSDLDASNYETVFDQAIADLGGKAFITEYVGLLSSPGYEPSDAKADMDLARKGLGSTAMLTRLRTRMAPAAFTLDLELAPAADQSQVGASFWLNDGQLSSSGKKSTLGLLGLVMLALFGRRQRRER